MLETSGYLTIWFERQAAEQSQYPGTFAAANLEPCPIGDQTCRKPRRQDHGGVQMLCAHQRSTRWNGALRARPPFVDGDSGAFRSRTNVFAGTANR